MPGRRTFTATDVPSSNVALCTCAMEAEPSGRSSMLANTWLHDAPYERSIVAITWSNGTGGTLARNFSNASQYSLGSTSLRFEAIWPIFT